MLVTLLDAISQGLQWLAIAFIGYCVIVLFAAACYGVFQVLAWLAQRAARAWRKLPR